MDRISTHRDWGIDALPLHNNLKWTHCKSEWIVKSQRSHSQRSNDRSHDHVWLAVRFNISTFTNQSIKFLIIQSIKFSIIQVRPLSQYLPSKSKRATKIFMRRSIPSFVSRPEVVKWAQTGSRHGNIGYFRVSSLCLDVSLHSCMGCRDWNSLSFWQRILLDKFWYLLWSQFHWDWPTDRLHLTFIMRFERM